MSDERDESAAELQQHWHAMTDTGLAALAEGLAASGPLPQDLSCSPMIIDTDIGGDADDALAIAAAARKVPQLALVLTGDEVHGQRARFARHLLDLMGRQNVRIVAGAALGESRYYCVDGLVPDNVPRQPTDVVAAVRAVCAATDRPVRWVGMAPLTNLAHVLATAPELAPRLRVTQMGGALRYRHPDRAEHNVRLDVASARACLKAVADGLLPTPEFIASEVTFTPEMEVTAASPLYAALRAAEAPPWAGLLADHLDRWFAAFHPGTLQHDALTLSAALDLPFVDSDRLTIAMDDIGRTTQAPAGQGAMVRWSLTAEYTPFMHWLTTALTTTDQLASERGR